MALQSVDTAAYILTSDIGLIGVFRTEEERTKGLHVDEMASRLPEHKKVNPHKLARCLRLLSTEHWYVFETITVDDSMIDGLPLGGQSPLLERSLRLDGGCSAPQAARRGRCTTRLHSSPSWRQQHSQNT